MIKVLQEAAVEEGVLDYLIGPLISSPDSAVALFAKSVKDQMEKASDDLDFEKAVILRDRIKSLNIIQSSQRINEANLIEADVIAGYKESGKTCIQVFFYRSKQNWGNQAFFPKHDPDEKLSDILNSFVSQFYENKSVPSSIILSEEIKEKDLIEKTLSHKEEKQIDISVAKKVRN